MELPSHAIRRLGGAPLAFAILAALGACVSFPDVLDGGGGTGGAGVGTGTSASAGGGTSTGGSSVTGSSTGGGEAPCEEAPPGEGGGASCLSERNGDTDQATLSNTGSDLRMVPSNGDAWWQGVEGDFFFTTVSGDFAAVVEVVVGVSQEAGAVFEVGGLLVRDPDAWVKFEAGRYAPATGGNALRGVLLGHTDTGISEHLGDDSGPYYLGASDTTDPEVGPITLGLCRDESEGFAFYYQDGSGWIPHPTVPIPTSQAGGTPAPLGSLATTVEIGLIAGDYEDSGQIDTVATFRRFRIGPLDSDLSGCTEDLDALVGEGLSHCGFCVE